MKLRLGEMTLDLDARQLVRGADEVHLSPKAFELLKILVENRPRALAKNELHERLWPATFVSEVNLAALIAEIRDALGDDARKPVFVRTAHRFGYAFSGSALETPRIEPARATFCWLVKDGRRLPLRPGREHPWTRARRRDRSRIADSVAATRAHRRLRGRCHPRGSGQ